MKRKLKNSIFNDNVLKFICWIFIIIFSGIIIFSIAKFAIILIKDNNPVEKDNKDNSKYENAINDLDNINKIINKEIMIRKAYLDHYLESQKYRNRK